MISWVTYALGGGNLVHAVLPNLQIDFGPLKSEYTKYIEPYIPNVTMHYFARG